MGWYFTQNSSKELPLLKSIFARESFFSSIAYSWIISGNVSRLVLNGQLVNIYCQLLFEKFGKYRVNSSVKLSICLITISFNPAGSSSSEKSSFSRRKDEKLGVYLFIRRFQRFIFSRNELIESLAIMTFVFLPCNLRFKLFIVSKKSARYAK